MIFAKKYSKMNLFRPEIDEMSMFWPIIDEIINWCTIFIFFSQKKTWNQRCNGSNNEISFIKWHNVERSQISIINALRRILTKNHTN